MAKTRKTGGVRPSKTADAFSPKEISVIKKLSTPQKVQDFLDALAINFERDGETCMSARRALRARKAHCIEGAFIAAAVLSFHGHEPLLLDLRAIPADDDHVVALYRQNGLWGAISKSNHTSLRFRDPVYRTVRELAISYFHEYFINKTGQKSLRYHSGPFSLKRFGDDWITSEEELWHIAVALDDSPHFPLFPKKNEKFIRKADGMERRAGGLVQWKKPRSRG